MSIDTMIHTQVTDIEKQLAVESSFNDSWKQYMGALELGILHNPFGIPESRITKPALRFICKGIGNAGLYEAWRAEQIITINTAYIPDNGILMAENKQTVAHELAHHLTYILTPSFKQWHGPEFKHIMKSIGYDGDTYHCMSVSSAKRVAKQTARNTVLFEL
jgi:hypothetical protein